MSDAEDGEEIEAPPAPLKIMEAALDTQYAAPEERLPSAEHHDVQM